VEKDGMEADYLLEFYGTECVHCKKMEPLMERLEDELGITLKRLEVWHNQVNATLLKQYDQGFCGGVPFFFNTRTNKWLCGDASYETLKAWAQG
jgi:thiol-disulfide isomerase/thioredoxin